jgi:hypothetical protein
MEEFSPDMRLEKGDRPANRSGGPTEPTSRRGKAALVQRGYEDLHGVDPVHLFSHQSE